jgi:hypothetical protein
MTKFVGEKKKKKQTKERKTLPNFFDSTMQDFLFIFFLKFLIMENFRKFSQF